MTDNDAILHALGAIREDLRGIRQHMQDTNDRIDKHAEYWSIMFFMGKTVAFFIGIASVVWAGITSWFKIQQ